MRCAVFDIETSGPEAVGSGFLMCVVVKPLEADKPTILRYDKLGCKPGHETALVSAVVDFLSNYDLLIGHNILRFDLPYLRSRAIQLDLPYKLEPFVYDTCLAFRRTGYRTVVNRIGQPTASLAHVIDFFGIELEKEYPLLPRQHWKAIWQEGDSRDKAMNRLVAHCTADVLANEQVYWKLLKSDRVWGLRRAK